MRIRSALITAVCALITHAASAQEVFSSGPINLPIVDGSTTAHTIFGGDFSRSIADLNVRLNITHTFDADLDIVLVAPGNLGYVHLCSDVGGSGQNMIGTTFDDQAPTSITTAVAPMTGSFRPEGGTIAWIGNIPLPATALANLASLNGTESLGEWTLLVYDDAAQDVGVLQDWTLIFTYLPNIDPQISFFITPFSIPQGGTAVVRAQVTPGANPASNSFSFGTNFQGFGSPGPISSFRDDGVFPDVTAGDRNFAAQITIPQNAQPGSRFLNIDVLDDWGRQGVSSDSFEILDVTPGACCINGVCSVVTPSECASAGGSFQGPDTICQDTDEYAITGTSFNFQDIAATGSIGPTGDDQVVQVPLGFTVSFYGYAYTDIFISSNGMVSFGSGSNEWNNTTIPNPAAPNNAIYALWDDFNPAAGGHVYYQAIDPGGPNPRFIVQWDHVPQFNQNDSNTFQIMIRPNGFVNLNYLAISSFAEGDATIGMENGPGSQANSLSTSFVHSGISRLAIYRPRTCFEPCVWHMDGCYADFNNDGGIDGDDVIAFFADWDAGRGCADADFSGGTDGDDVIAFFGSWDMSGAGIPGC